MATKWEQTGRPFSPKVGRGFPVRASIAQLMIECQREAPVRPIFAFPIVDAAVRDNTSGRIGLVGPDIFTRGGVQGDDSSFVSPAQRARRGLSAD